MQPSLGERRCELTKASISTCTMLCVRSRVASTSIIYLSSATGLVVQQIPTPAHFPSCLLAVRRLPLLIELTTLEHKGGRATYNPVRILLQPRHIRLFHQLVPLRLEPRNLFGEFLVFADLVLVELGALSYQRPLKLLQVPPTLLMSLRALKPSRLGRPETTGGSRTKGIQQTRDCPFRE